MHSSHPFIVPTRKTKRIGVQKFKIPGLHQRRKGNPLPTSQYHISMESGILPKRFYVSIYRDYYELKSAGTGVSSLLLHEGIKDSEESRRNRCN
jgi:hypothetical protein